MINYSDWQWYNFDIYIPTRNYSSLLLLRDIFLSATSGKLHRALRLSVEHIPDSELQDIQEVDEEGVEEEIEENLDSENEFDVEDGSKEAKLNQDGVTSDENDIEPFSKSRNCLTIL